MLAHNYKPSFTCFLLWDIISPLQTTMYTYLSNITYPLALSSDQVRYTCIPVVPSTYFQPSTDHYFYLLLFPRDHKLPERPTPIHPLPISTAPISVPPPEYEQNQCILNEQIKHFYESIYILGILPRIYQNENLRSSQAAPWKHY